LLFLKTKEKEKENLHLGPWTSFFFSPRVPGWFEKQRRGGRPESGVGAHRGRGESGGKASRRREEPKGGLGWARDGWRRRLRGAGAPAAAFGGGGGGPVVRGGGERVGEHRWRPRELAAGVVGHEGGRRRGLRGSLGRGGANGGGVGRFRAEGQTGRGARAQGGRREE